MFAGVLAAAAAGGLGANALVALLAAVVVGMVALRALRDPPWTMRGRRAWRSGWQRWWDLMRAFAARSRGPGPGRGPGGGRSWRRGGGGDVADFTPPGAPTGPPEVRPGSRLPVRCEVATERLQVWHSTATQRAYEVPAERGLAGATPGVVADLVFERGRPRVLPREVN